MKRCREQAGLTQETVGRHFEWHAAKVTRIETARVAVTARDVKDLLSLYGVQDETYREALMEPIVLPGLLQTEAYMRALMRTGRAQDPPHQVDRRVALRPKRQGRLRATNPLELLALVDESVGRRVIGGADVTLLEFERPLT